MDETEDRVKSPEKVRFEGRRQTVRLPGPGSSAQQVEEELSPSKRTDGIIEAKAVRRGGLSEEQKQAMVAELAVLREEDRIWRDEETRKIVGLTCPDEGPLVDYLWTYSMATGADPTWHLHASLALLSTIAHAWGFLPPLIGGASHFSVSSIAIGESGSAKSTVVRDLLSFRRALYAKLGVSDKSLPRAVQFSGTYPGIFEAIADARIGDTDTRALLLYQDEYTTLFNKTKYGWDTQSVCQIADGDPLERHLRSVKLGAKSGDNPNVERIERFAAPIVFATTAETHANLIQAQGAPMVLGGMASRFLWGYSDGIRSTLQKVIQKEDFEAALASWHALIQWMDAMKIAHCTPDAHYLRMTFPDYLQVILAKSLRVQSDSKETPGHLRQLWKRGFANAPMLAALFALQSHRLEVTQEDVLRAVELVVRSVAHYELIYRKSRAEETLAPPKPVFSVLVDRLNAELLKAQHKGIPRKDLYRLLGKPKKHELDEAIDTLDEQDLITCIRTPTAGRTAETFYATKYAPGKHLRIVPPKAPDESDAENVDTGPASE